MSNSFNRVYIATCGYIAPTMGSLSIIIVLTSLFDVIAIIALTWLNRVWYQKDKPVETEGNDGKGTLPPHPDPGYAPANQFASPNY